MLMLALNKRHLFILLTIPLLLLIPFLAMQFTSEVNWSPADFLLMGVLLLGIGLAGEWIWRRVKSPHFRLVLLLSLLTLFLLTWMELAVGIFGTPFAGS